MGVVQVPDGPVEPVLLGAVALARGRVRFDPGQPRVQQLPGAADANCWCQTLPTGTGFEAAQVSLVSCAVPTHRGSNGSDLALSASSPGVRRSTC